MSICYYCNRLIEFSYDHEARCAIILANIEDVFEELLSIAKEVRINHSIIEYPETPQSLKWDGKKLLVCSFDINTVSTFAHELAHFIHASEEDRKLRNFGMSINPHDLIEEFTVDVLTTTMLMQLYKDVRLV